MGQDLKDAIRRYTEAHADETGVARTDILGVSLVRTTSTGELRYAVQRPLICLVVQGTKIVSLGNQSLAFSGGDSMLITTEVPTVTQITRASVPVPYLSFALYLDAALIADLSAEMKAVAADSGSAMRLQPTDTEVADTALRLIQLLERPAAIPVLQRQLVREMHYWLLAGQHGPAIRQLGFPDSRARRIARAVNIIRNDFSSLLRVEQLAAAGMSSSTFHQHFREITSLSPLQFQKQLRLIEARRLMLAQGLKPSRAAYEVGYGSVPQFTREYRRLFGLPPMKEINVARRSIQAA